MNLRLVVLVVIGMMLLTACGGESAEPEVELTVAAASDLQAAFTEIGTMYEAETGQAVTFSFGSTGNLATQIENGAPFDVFAAANEAFVDDLIEKGAVDADSKRFYAIGRIVIASNVASGVDVQDLEGLLGPEIKHVAIANPEHAPYGIAAREAFISAGIWDGIQPKIVYGENIRQTLQFIQTGNAEAGIVALSIADVPGVTYAPIDESLHTPLLQAMGVVSESPQMDEAGEFINFVIGPQGSEILADYGFTLPDQP